jgi:hypothetical protein
MIIIRVCFIALGPIFKDSVLFKTVDALSRNLVRKWNCTCVLFRTVDALSRNLVTKENCTCNRIIAN